MKWKRSVNRTEKQELVDDLHKVFARTNLVIVTRQSGMTVSEASTLRQRMRTAGASYKVTQNRLTRLALKGTQFEALQSLFTGPTAIAYSDDPVAAAKICVEFAKGNDKLTIVGGALAGEELDNGRISELAKLPSLDALRSQLIGILQAPATKLAVVTQAPAAQLVRVFNAYAEKDQAA